MSEFKAFCIHNCMDVHEVVCVCARIRFHIEFCRQGLIFVALAMQKDSINKRNVFIIYEIIVCLFGGFSGFAVHFFYNLLAC